MVELVGLTVTRPISDNSRDRQKVTEAQIRQMQSFLCTGSDKCDECGALIKIATSLDDTPTGLRFTDDAGEAGVCASYATTRSFNSLRSDAVWIRHFSVETVSGYKGRFFLSCKMAGSILVRRTSLKLYIFLAPFLVAYYLVIHYTTVSFWLSRLPGSRYLLVMGSAQ